MRRAGSRDIAPQIRGAFKRAVLQLEEEGRPLSELIKEYLEKDFLGTLRAIQGFIPKEQLIGPMEESEGSFSVQVNFVEPRLIDAVSAKSNLDADADSIGNSRPH
jgi:hypothetical protein